MQNIYKALLKSQSEFDTIDKNGTNPHYKSKYATLPNVLSTVLPVLQSNGVLFTAKEVLIDGAQFMELSLIHAETAEAITSRIKLLGCTDMQKYGSSTTYALRYGILAMLGISPDLDDDGNLASATPQAKPAPRQPAKPRPEEAALIEAFNLKKHLIEEKYIKSLRALVDDIGTVETSKLVQWTSWINKLQPAETN